MQEFIHRFLVVGGHGASAGPDGFAGQIKILTDMTGLDGDHLRRSKAIAPFHTIRNRRPDERDGCFRRTGLAEGRFENLFLHVFVLIFKQQLMFQGQVTVQARIKGFNI